MCRFEPSAERNRGESGKTNRYLKMICYGNLTPLLDGAGKRPRWLTSSQIQDTQWLFEVVFDYGEHYPTAPKPNDAEDWLCRPDPFSSYRAGFEVRTYRRCHRVLMFHHFPEELGREDYLVRSTELIYEDSPIASFITAVTQSGYVYQPDIAQAR